MHRREFITVSTKLGILAMMSLLGVGCQAKPRPVIGLGDLPYPLDALEPYISSRTLTFHHKKHHKNYVDTLNRLIKGTSYRNMSLSEIVKRSSEDPNAQKIFNQAAQVFNHDFYWKSMKPGGGDHRPDPWKLASAIHLAAIANSTKTFPRLPRLSSGAVGCG
ncbi:Superoxide dismutase [Fe] (EC [Olavius algarvensis associated proteobacterium Delta 3]|nr:Superoxide dismutase [Fe] (EC [Olavius algarvensis associated proteobacterium Delta 3]